jgi:Uma2 family endonuclease
MMATAATGTAEQNLPFTEPAPEERLVSVEEYLRTSYTPDVEYLEGRLKEKSVVGFPHGRMQALLSAWFWNHAREWKIQVAVETRTRVKVARFRLPDLVVVAADEQTPSALQSAPLIAIEVLSPSDEFADLRARARDLAAMGCQNVWLVDPAEASVAVWNGETWQPFHGEQLQATGTEAFLDLEWMRKQLA